MHAFHFISYRNEHIYKMCVFLYLCVLINNAVPCHAICITTVHYTEKLYSIETLTEHTNAWAYSTHFSDTLCDLVIIFPCFHFVLFCFVYFSRSPSHLRTAVIIIKFAVVFDFISINKKKKELALLICVQT